MTTPGPHLELGALVNEAWRDAIQSWVAEHNRGSDPEVWRNSQFVTGALTVQLNVGKPVYCYVEITARRPWESATYGYVLKAAGPGKDKAAVGRLL